MILPAPVALIALPFLIPVFAAPARLIPIPKRNTPSGTGDQVVATCDLWTPYGWADIQTDDYTALFWPWSKSQFNQAAQFNFPLLCPETQFNVTVWPQDVDKYDLMGSQPIFEGHCLIEGWPSGTEEHGVQMWITNTPPYFRREVQSDTIWIACDTDE